MFTPPRAALSRRDVLTGLGATLGAAALGCGGSSPAGPPDAAGSAPDGSGPVADAAPPDADPLAHCREPGDLSPEELLAHVDTIVVLCMENRSFDHYLGSLRLREGRHDVEGLLGTESNPDGAGAPVAVHELATYTASDPPHGWDACHEQWNQGANDGFVQAHEAEAMGYYVREQLPVLYALADGGAVCHHWYSAVMGPTWPNRYYLHGGTAHGRKSNFPPIAGFRSIFEVLDGRGISHRNYYHDVAWATAAYFKFSGNDGIEDYFDAAASGTLPQVCYIDPKFLGQGANDDHPEHDIRLGQALMGSVFAALAQGPQWLRSLFVVTYDEHGGFYDHVPPPTTTDDDADFRQLGFRVPGVVLGPSVRRGCAIDQTFEHTSVVSTITRRFGLEPLNERVATTSDLSPCIDPALIDNPQPPPAVPAVEISLRAVAERPAAPDAHHEIEAALAGMRVPSHLDRRGRDMEITEAWLRRAERIGAVRLID